MKFYIVAQSHDAEHLWKRKYTEDNRLLYEKETGFTSAEVRGKHFYDCYGDTYMIRELETKKRVPILALPGTYDDGVLLKAQIAMVDGQKVRFEKKAKLDGWSDKVVDYYITSTTGNVLPEPYMENEKCGLVMYGQSVGVMAYINVDAAVKKIRNKIGFAYAIYCNYGN